MICSSLRLLRNGHLDIWVGKYVAPKTGNLMGIIDLHDVELLDDLLIYLDLPLFEHWDDLLAQINRNEVVKLIQ